MEMKLINFTVKKSLFLATVMLLLSGTCSAMDQELFDAGGYYYPKADIVISGYRVEWFNLETVTYYNNDELDYDHPKPIGPNASIMLVKVKDNKKHRYSFPNPKIGKDEVLLNSVVTPIGNIVIKGKFLDARGMFWNRADVKPMVTPVFEGTLTVLRKGRRIYSEGSSYVFWEGD